MANVLSRTKQEMVIRCLVDGASVRATERISSVHRDTILRLMVRIGEGCQRLMDREIRDLTCQRIQVDEIWSFGGKKQRRLTTYDDPTKTGDQWVFVAIVADSKLIPCYRSASVPAARRKPSWPISNPACRTGCYLRTPSQPTWRPSSGLSAATWTMGRS